MEIFNKTKNGNSGKSGKSDESKKPVIAIGGRSTGRIATALKASCEARGIESYMVELPQLGDNSDSRRFNEMLESVFRGGCTDFVATAWFTGEGYKDSSVNRQFAIRTVLELELAKNNGVHTIYLGTDDNGMAECEYTFWKRVPEPHADFVIKVPHVWQPGRKDSLAWRVWNRIPTEFDNSRKIAYVTDADVVEAVLDAAGYPTGPKMYGFNFLGMNIVKRTPEEWAELFSKASMPVNDDGEPKE